MPARLFCKTGELAGAAFVIRREATIGRLEDNQITLYPSYVSGYHARIFFDDDEGRYFLEDLRSSNGTELDGTPVTAPVRLGRLHVITFAHQVDFIFPAPEEEAVPDFGVRALDVPATDDSQEKTYIGDIFAPLPSLPSLESEGVGEKTMMHDPFTVLPELSEPEDIEEKTTFREAFTPLPTLEMTPLPEAQTPSETPPLSASEDTPGDEETILVSETAPTRFKLVVTMPDETLETFALEEGGQVVGRELACDLTIPHTSISRRHARITVEGGTVMLEDMGSKNGTFVDSTRITMAVPIRPGNVIRLGLTIKASLEGDS